MNVLVSYILEGDDHHHHTTDVFPDKETNTDHKATHNELDELVGDLECKPHCCTKDPVSQLATVTKITSILQHEQEQKDESIDVLPSHLQEDDFVDTIPLPDQNSCEGNTHPTDVDDLEEQRGPVEIDDRESRENKRLAKMGMTTALAVAIHNFPEGLATFVAALNDPKVGAVLAIAISVHNIPEGLCIAPPIYYATGNRTKAFLWALMSGVSELVAAFLGWLVLSNVFTDATYGTLFGIVAGMMVTISIRELLPTAHFYDPEDKIVTYAFIAGTMFMALSLVLFVI